MVSNEPRMRTINLHDEFATVVDMETTVGN